MLPVSETVFWICFLIVFYTYAGYPLLLSVLVFLKKVISPPLSSYINIYDTVTFVVAAYNEEDILEEKIKNCFSLDYPADKIKFLFITDGSDDNTSTILKKYPSILHLHENERKLPGLRTAFGHGAGILLWYQYGKLYPRRSAQHP